MPAGCRRPMTTREKFRQKLGLGKVLRVVYGRPEVSLWIFVFKVENTALRWPEEPSRNGTTVVCNEDAAPT